MASGSALTVSGGFTMTQVVANTDVPVIADFNNIRSNLDRLLGTGTGTLSNTDLSNKYGYNQGGIAAGVDDAASVGDLIRALGTEGAFRELQDFCERLEDLRGISNGMTLVSAGNTITAADWNALMNRTKAVFDGRFSTVLKTTASGANSGALNVNVNLGSRTHITTVDFGSAAAAKGYFNAGGLAGISLFAAQGTAGTESDYWADSFLAKGDIRVGYNQATWGGGSNASGGYYDIGTGYTTLFTQTSIGGAYTGNSWSVSAARDASGRYLYFRTIITDGNDTGTIDEPTNINVTTTGRYTQPQTGATYGSFTWATPSYTFGSWS